MPPEALRYRTANIDDIFNVPKFCKAGGFRDDTEIFFYNHHESHALALLFFQRLGGSARPQTARPIRFTTTFSPRLSAKAGCQCWSIPASTSTRSRSSTSRANASKRCATAAFDFIVTMNGICERS
jgi:hypothetical protein